MYARVAVASDALSTPGLPHPAANLVHRTLLEQINAHGRLVFGDDPEVMSLVEAIRSGAGIPQDARTRWIETLTRLRKHGRIKVLHNHAALADATALREVRADWGTCADLAIVASQSCDSLGIPSDIGFLTDSGVSPDVAITSAATDTPSMQRQRALADAAMAASGSPRDSFWHQVLEPLATDARSVTVLDAYLFKSTWDITDQRPHTRGWGAEQVVWLLGHLDAVMAPQAEVHLVGSRQRNYRHMDAERTADAVRAQWGPTRAGRLKNVSVSLGDAKPGERFPHDRHLRFSTGGAVEISAGLDRLRQDRIWDPDGMKWKYIWNTGTLRALRDAEERAVALARQTPSVILVR